ncbi:MAG: hypothetical protein WKF73_05695 [Nocardioidaceae bacterium]
MTGADFQRQPLVVGAALVLGPAGALGGIEAAVPINFSLEPLDEPATSGSGGRSGIAAARPAFMGRRSWAMRARASEWVRHTSQHLLSVRGSPSRRGRYPGVVLTGYSTTRRGVGGSAGVS